ncbi:hypothetical protein K9M43_02085 [Candidatus Gracilibacteria bacterium]|nr:hypothetical protein [Candidatus Gracilibacteria bacterium]
MNDSRKSCEKGECGCQLQKVLVASENFFDERDVPRVLNIATHLRNVLRKIYKITGMEDKASKGKCPLEKLQRKLGVWDKNAPSCHHE